jgi:hypothetical protein
MQSDIASAFNKFLNLKKLCDEKKIEIDCQKLQKTSLVRILYFSFQILFGLSMQVMSSKGPMSWQKFLLLALNIFGMAYTVDIACFLSVVLIHFEFLIENYNAILDRELKKYFHDHEKCRELLMHSNDIRELFGFFNRSIGKLLSINVINIMISLIRTVSFQLF